MLLTNLLLDGNIQHGASTGTLYRKLGYRQVQNAFEVTFSIWTVEDMDGHTSCPGDE